MLAMLIVTQKAVDIQERLPMCLTMTAIPIATFVTLAERPLTNLIIVATLLVTFADLHVPFIIFTTTIVMLIVAFVAQYVA